MKASSKIVFFGNERLSTGFNPEGAPTLQALLDNNYDVVAVVANFQESSSRKARPLEIISVAKKHNIPVLLPTKLADIHDELVKMQPTAGVLVAYGKIIPQAIIDIFPKGIINIHPSLLPLYRGSTPIEQAILDGTPQTGVSLMRLTKQMDAGPLFGQEVVALRGTETKADLTSKLLTLGGEMLIQKLPALIDGSLEPTPQNEPQATYCGLLTKADGQLDLKKTATRLEREVRAYLEWPKSRITLFEQHVIITKARVAKSPQDGALVIACGSGSSLEILTLTAPSGKTMTGDAFLRGYKK